jgi:hypothetical protein
MKLLSGCAGAGIAGILLILVGVPATYRAQAAQTLGGQRPVIGAPGPNRLSNADQNRLDRLLADHRAARFRRPQDQRTDLDLLTARVRDAIFPEGASAADPWGKAKAIVRAAAPGLPQADGEVLSAYALDGIAAGDLDVMRFAKTQLDFYALRSFSQNYLQLQSQMQNVNRAYAVISAIMKTKHDTVKNAVSNMR